MLDNGLKRISNLTPVRNTLVSLCLCDQSITVMENLSLPNLRELFLHRNNIEVINGLRECPRLKRLWLFQNKIAKITDLYSVPELKECWLQANQITSLDGLEHCMQIEYLGMAGNPISDFSELKKLTNMTNLQELSLNDVHFGRCLVAEDKGYKEFVLCFFKGVKILDGVNITSEKQASAESIYSSQLQIYNNSLNEIEEDYRRDLQVIESNHRSRENHALVLEKEMSSALIELQKIVSDGRSQIFKGIDKQKKILDNNIRAFETDLIDIHEKAITKLMHKKLQAVDENDQVSALFCALERLTAAESSLVTMLCDVSKILYKRKSSNVIQDHNIDPLIFTIVANNTPDYQMLSNMINSSKTPKPKGSRKIGHNKYNEGTENNFTIEVFKLYHLHALPHCLNVIKIDRLTKNAPIRAFTSMSLTEFNGLLQDGWKSFSSSMILSSSPEIAASLCCSDGGSFKYDFELCEQEIDSKKSKKDKDFLNLLEMPLLSQAMASKIILLLSCRLDLNAAGLGDQSMNSGNPNKLTMPLSSSARAEIINGLRQSPKAVSLDVDVIGGQDTITGKLYVLPNMHDTTSGSKCSIVSFEFASICISPSFEACDLKSLESKLETFIMPRNSIDINLNILTDYEGEVAKSVKRYIDQVLEEVDDTTAISLRNTDTAMAQKEIALRHIKEEIDKERKVQENILKDLKKEVANAESNNSSNSAKANSVSKNNSRRF